MESVVIVGPIEAVIVDATHLELKTPLLETIGQRLLVHIVPLPESPERTLRELEAAYRNMSEQERQAEIALAEEGMWGQLPVEAFSEEEEWSW
jgi:hypothetical protein